MTFRPGQPVLNKVITVFPEKERDLPNPQLHTLVDRRDRGKYHSFGVGLCQACETPVAHVDNED
jgi:hypothetical protein